MELNITEIIDHRALWEIRHVDVKTDTGAVPGYQVYKEIEYKLESGEIIVVPTCKCRDEYDKPEKGGFSMLYYNLIRKLNIEELKYNEQADLVIAYCLDLFERGYKWVKIYHPALYVQDGPLIRDYIISKLRTIFKDDYEKLKKVTKVVKFYD